MRGFQLYELLIRVAARLRTMLVRRAFYEFGDRSVLMAPVRLAGVERIAMGSRVYVGSGCWLQGTVSDVPLAADGKPTLRIGSGVSFSGYATVSAAQSVVIEDRVLIARGVFICDHTHEVRGHVPICDQGVTGLASIRICQGAWIGQNSVIMPGVTVGAGAVVAANSLVNEDVAPRTIVGGTPAKLLRVLP